MSMSFAGTLPAALTLSATALLVLSTGAAAESFVEHAERATVLPAGTYAEPPADADPAADIAVAPADPDSFFEGWTGSFAFGMNGASGNTERFGLRAQFDARRETSKIVTSFGALYVYATDDGNKSEHRGELNARNDWKLGEDSRWRIYALGRAEYNEFKDWRWRVSAFAGVGYALIQNETTLFLPRVGIGGSREFGGTANDIVPELNLGWDFEHKFNENVKFFNVFDYYPSLKNFSDFRMETSAGLDVLLSKENNLSLRLGVENRHDSTPEGAKKNDFTYFALIAYNF